MFSKIRLKHILSPSSKINIVFVHVWNHDDFVDASKCWFCKIMVFQHTTNSNMHFFSRKSFVAFFKMIFILFFMNLFTNCFVHQSIFLPPIRIAVVVWTLCLGDVTIRYISHAKHLLPLVILWGRHQLKRYFHCSYWWILPNIAVGYGLYEVIISHSHAVRIKIGWSKFQVRCFAPLDIDLMATNVLTAWNPNYLGYIGLLSTTNFQGDSTSSVVPKTNVAKYEGPNYAREPCFARPERKESIVSNSVVQPVTKMQGYNFDSLEPPSFSRPSKQNRQGEQLNNEKRMHHSEIGD